jgi:hypothetical protein
LARSPRGVRPHPREQREQLVKPDTKDQAKGTFENLS